MPPYLEEAFRRPGTFSLIQFSLCYFPFILLVDSYFPEPRLGFGRDGARLLEVSVFSD